MCTFLTFLSRICTVVALLFFEEASKGETAPCILYVLKRPPLKACAVRRRVGAFVEKSPVAAGQLALSFSISTPRRLPFQFS